ncbi:GNAT family N-acetyltransferase [Streptomyces sp. NPDC002766]|uniref:GNAT family N-acetyltransferase n=1 Tax=Streptomyces sp. NPDC002766 TaxID=3154429 RepID=UPI003323B2DF
MWKCDIVNGAELDIEEVVALYHASTLGQRRPVEQRERFAAMVRGANLVITARLDGRLIGIARSLTDGAYVTYLSDIAVDAEFQRQGVGRSLIRAVQEAAPQAKIVLLSAPAAVDYYPHVGFTRHNSAWVLDALE